MRRNTRVRYCALRGLDWLAVCQQLAAMTKELETAEFDDGSGAG
jgi:hypothetical protein